MSILESLLDCSIILRFLFLPWWFSAMCACVCEILYKLLFHRWHLSPGAHGPGLSAVCPSSVKASVDIKHTPVWTIFSSARDSHSRYVVNSDTFTEHQMQDWLLILFTNWLLSLFFPTWSPGPHKKLKTYSSHWIDFSGPLLINQ